MRSYARFMKVPRFKAVLLRSKCRAAKENQASAHEIAQHFVVLSKRAANRRSRVTFTVRAESAVSCEALSPQDTDDAVGLNVKA